jgi:hypothetical protein
MKFATFVEAPSGRSPANFQDWFSSVFLPYMAAAAPTMRGCVYRNVRDSPGTEIDKISTVDPNFGNFHVLLETWFSSAEDFRRESLPAQRSLDSMSARHISYLVTPRLQKDPRISESGADGRRPEITVVCSLKWKEGVTSAEASTLWSRHAGIALRCHSVITKYEQNIVEEVMSWTDGVEPVDAFGDFSFRTVADCQAHFRATPEERQDASGFSGGGRFTYLEDARPALR